MDAKIAQLRSQIQAYEAMLQKPLDDPSMVYIGDGYFRSMPAEEARQFIEQRIGKNREELDTLRQMNGINENGLPVFDIVEELDDEGNVINSSMNRTGFSAEFKAALDAQKVPIESNTEDNSVPEVVEPEEESVSKVMNANISDGEVEEINETIEDVEMEDVTSSRYAENKSNGEFADSDPAEVLELELLQTDSDDEPVNFDFDDIDEDDEVPVEVDDDEMDDDDDDDDDDNDYGWSGGFFPTNDATMRVIEAHLAKTTPSNEFKTAVERHEPQQQSPVKQSADDQSPQDQSPDKEISVVDESVGEKKSHVHFSDKVDVREFDLTPAERKTSAIETHFRAPVISRFKSARMAMSPNRTPAPPTALPKVGAGSAVAGAAAAAAAASKSGPARSAVPGNVVERETPAPAPKPLFKPIHYAKPPPRMARAASPLTSAPLATTRLTTGLQTSPAKPATKPPSFLRNPTVAHHPVNRQTQVAQADTKESKLDMMSKVNEDAEKIFEYSFIPDVEFLKLHDKSEGDSKDAKHDDVRDIGGLKPAGDVVERPVLSSVMERDSPDMDHVELDDNSVNMSEIKQDYQRLRQKLIYESGGFKKKDEEKEFEPMIDDTGAPKKVSRFKAAKIG